MASLQLLRQSYLEVLELSVSLSSEDSSVLFVEVAIGAYLNK